MKITAANNKIFVGSERPKGNPIIHYPAIFSFLEAFRLKVGDCC
jgi:hypothetical protein